MKIKELSEKELVKVNGGWRGVSRDNRSIADRILDGAKDSPNDRDCYGGYRGRERNNSMRL